VRGKKKRKNGGDMIVIDPLSKLKQEMSSRDTINDEVGTVEDNTKEDSGAPDSREGESDNSESSGPG
jgi:hypothetical protein